MENLEIISDADLNLIKNWEDEIMNGEFSHFYYDIIGH